jgi:hypothetical protein
MQKVDGVQAVKVSLNDGLTILDLKPGNTITLTKIRQVIKNNGFISKEATVVARGAPSRVGGDLYFTVSGTNEDLAVSVAPRHIGEEWQLAIRAPAKP